MGNVQIYQLSQQFYDDYPEQLFPEIERKSERPYTILVVEITSELKIGIPFRSHISHRNAYHFRMSKRSSNSKSGLDFSKIVILSSSDYIGNAAQIDRDEFTEYKKNIATIQKESKKYVLDYCNHHKQIKILGKTKYRNAYQYTTLQYFHSELKL